MFSPKRFYTEPATQFETKIITVPRRKPTNDNPPAPKGTRKVMVTQDQWTDLKQIAEELNAVPIKFMGEDESDGMPEGELYPFGVGVAILELKKLVAEIERGYPSGE